MNTLFVRSVRTALIGVIVLGALLFVPAGTLNYWQGWLFIITFTLSTSVIGVYLSLKDPALLERRMKFGPAAEQRTTQKIIISIASIAFLAEFVFCALDYRFGWSPVPPVVSIFGDVLVALGLFIDLRVFRENSFGASNIRTIESQKVISTGPYALVRHPMYVGVLVMCVGVPLALGSWWGLVFLLLTVPVLVSRILDEEKLLRNDLPGYTDYTHQVRYRLVPHLW